MATYRAIKYKTDPTSQAICYDALLYYSKALINTICANHNGLTRIGNWEEDIYHDTPSSGYDLHYSFKGYFSLDGGSTKQFMLSDKIQYTSSSDPEEIFWAEYYDLGMCSANNTANTPDGIYTHNEVAFAQAIGTWEDACDYNGADHWLMVYVDDSNNIIGISGLQHSPNYDSSNYGGVFIFERNANKVYTTIDDRYVCNITGDTYPVAKIIESGRSGGYDQQDNPYAFQEAIVLKDVVDNFVKYEGTTPLISLSNYDINAYRYNQRIQIGNQLYIHLGDSRLFLPITQYTEVVDRKSVV